MRLRLGVILLAVFFQGSFPARTSNSLRRRYGAPISETFLVRPGIVVTASYGAGDSTCELVISPKLPDGMIKHWPGDLTIDRKLLEAIEEELVPTHVRGKLKESGFVNLICPPENDCLGGTQQDWNNVSIYENPGAKGARYAVIQWHGGECPQKSHP